jgi:6-phosphogluconolactonase
MTANPEIIVHRDAGLLAKATAARLITGLIDAQAARGEAALVLTGGGIGVAVLRAVRADPAAEAVDWSKLDVWWGDERFVPRDSPDRNERQAREALLDHVPVREKRVFPMGHRAAPTAGGDVEGHAADSGAAEPEVAVHACPKPPPTRITLTLPAVQAARQVWVVVAGEEKADAAALSFSGADPLRVPAAGAVGRERTLWLVDRAAASRLPDS